MNMLKGNKKLSTGGKGNKGMFIERNMRVCAAGVPSAQPEQAVASCLEYYSLQDEVDALIGDAIKPYQKARILPPLRHQPKPDMRNAGPFSEACSLINPPVKTKFQTLVEDFKGTVYSSYWKKPIGTIPDQVPGLPPGFDICRTTLGKKTTDHGRLYDVVLPKNPLPETASVTKTPGYQTTRNYNKSSFDPDQMFGRRTSVDRRGKWMKCCLTDDRVLSGTLNKPTNAKLADFRSANLSQLGLSKTPNNNIDCVPPGYAFGILKPPDNLPECLTTCQMNPEREFFKKCLGHLNTLRKCLKKRFDGSFFHSLYLNLKYHDKNKSGWLSKKIVYDFCSTKYIRFDPALIEPLLATWNAYNGNRIEFKTFVNIINHTMPTPELPKVWDVPEECIDFRTTYTEMVKPDQKIDNEFMAGLPSGRYFDVDQPVTPQGGCKADRVYLPHESDAKICLNPSLLTLLGVSHRDMYAKRDPDVVRKVFKAAGEELTEEMFETIWNKAKEDHSQGWVCFETFRRALNAVNSKCI